MSNSWQRRFQLRRIIRDSLHRPLNSVAWNQEDAANNPPSLENVIAFTTPKELYSQGHTYVTEFLKSSSIHKLGELHVKDQAALNKLVDKPLLTLGTDNPEFDWSEAWEKALGIGHNERHTAADWGNEVTVEAWVLTVRDAIAPDHEGLLYPVLKGYQTGGVSLSMFGLPSIQAVIDFKWRTFAKTFVMVELLFMLLWASSFTVLGLLISQPGDLNPTGVWGHVANVCNVLALVATIPFVLIEVANMLDYGWDWFSIWNMTELSSCLLQVVFFVAHFKGDLDEPWVSSLLAIQNLLVWLRMFFLARAIQTSKRVSLVDILALVCMELKDFLALCAMLLWAFAFSFHVLFRMDAVTAFAHMGGSIMNVLKWMKAGSDMTIVTQVKAHELVTCMMLVLFQIVMAMMMMSLLIGVVNRSVVKAGENQDLKAFAAQAVIMIDLETTLPSWIERMFPRTWYPTYLHILRIKPSSLAVVDSKYTWQSSRVVTQSANAATKAANPPTKSMSINTATAPPPPAVSAAEFTSVTNQLQDLQTTLQSQTQLIQKMLAAQSAATTGAPAQ